MMFTVTSPELALVDPELRLTALADLPSVDPFDFLRFRHRPQPRPRAELPGVNFLPDYGSARVVTRRPALPLAAALYALWSFVWAAIMGSVVAFGLAVTVAAVNLFA
jgi:hypothetical protein